MLGKLIWKVSSPFRGRVRWAKCWDKLYQLSCAGLSLGQGENVATSGERVVLRRVKAYAADLIVFDVGANVGNYSKMVILELGEVEIHCFEPSISTYASLCNNLQDNNKVNLNNFGLSKEPGEASLYYDFKGSGIASLYNRQLDYHGIKFENKEEVKLDTLDNYCNKL